MFVTRLKGKVLSVHRTMADALEHMHNAPLGSKIVLEVDGMEPIDMTYKKSFKQVISKYEYAKLLGTGRRNLA